MFGPRSTYYLTRFGISSARLEGRCVEVDEREHEDGDCSAYFDVLTGEQLTEWSSPRELTAAGERALADVEEADRACGSLTLEESYATLGISHRPRLPGERGKMYSRTLLDASSGEPIATLDASEGWEFVRWCAGEVARG